MRKKAELENQLVRARGTDFADARTDQVTIGSRVQVTEPGSGHAERFTILGAWDSDPTNGIISYLSPVAQELLNHRPGEEVEFELEGVQRRYRIDHIERIECDESSFAPAAPSGADPTSTGPPPAEPTNAPSTE